MDELVFSKPPLHDQLTELILLKVPANERVHLYIEGQQQNYSNCV